MADSPDLRQPKNIKVYKFCVRIEKTYPINRKHIGVT